jgi:raffinose/stachyose/melibiose transport system substrate-binding protein
MSQHTPRLRRLTAPAISVLAVGALALTGCTAAPVEEATEFSLYFPVAESGDNPYKALADAYMDANPGITINVEEAGGDTYAQGLSTKLQAGNAPDVFMTAPGRGQLNSVLTLAEAGYLASLDDTDASTTIPAGNEALFEIDGSLYAQGLDFTVAAVVANLALMKADGLDGYPTTYDDLLDACAVARDNGHSFFVIAGSMQPNTGFFSMVMAGDLVYGPNPSWNVDRQADEVNFADDEGWQETLSRFEELNEAGCFQDSPEAGTFDTITNNLVGELSYAGAIPSGAAFGLGGANPDAEFVVNPFPAASADDAFVSASVNYALSINAKASPGVIALAKDFLNFASGDGADVYPAISGNLPVVGADFGALPPQYGGVAQLLTDGKTYALPNSGWESPEVYAALGTGVQGILTGQATVDDVLAEMDASW